MKGLHNVEKIRHTETKSFHMPIYIFSLERESQKAERNVDFQNVKLISKMKSSFIKREGRIEIYQTKM